MSSSLQDDTELISKYIAGLYLKNNKLFFILILLYLIFLRVIILILER